VLQGVEALDQQTEVRGRRRIGSSIVVGVGSKHGEYGKGDERRRGRRGEGEEKESAASRREQKGLLKAAGGLRVPLA